jgi:hypothetical protein
MKEVKSKVFLVYGPENSGNHLIRDFLKTFDVETDGNSVPCSINLGEMMPDIEKDIEYYRDKGKYVIVIVPIRDYYCMAQSKLRHGFATSFERAIQQIQEEYSYIFKTLVNTKVNFLLIPFSFLINNYEHLCREMKLFFNIRPKKDFRNQLFDSNKKHMEELCEKMPNY